jgi:hypothetical protein
MVPFRNVLEPGRPQMNIRRNHIAYWLTKATNTHSEYVTITAFLRQQWLHERATLLRCMYIDRLVSNAILSIFAYKCVFPIKH